MSINKQPLPNPPVATYYKTPPNAAYHQTTFPPNYQQESPKTTCQLTLPTSNHYSAHMWSHPTGLRWQNPPTNPSAVTHRQAHLTETSPRLTSTYQARYELWPPVLSHQYRVVDICLLFSLQFLYSIVWTDEDTAPSATIARNIYDSSESRSTM